MQERHGLIIVNTGNGKGKTTAALGLALRAWGQGFKILILQFIKGSWKYGELDAIAKLGSNLVIEQLGEGFVNHGQTVDDKEKHVLTAQATFDRAREELHSGKWDMVILDEINYAVQFGLIAVEKVVELLHGKPRQLHVVLTGRNAKPEIIDCADLVTEMREVKHPYKQGIKAQRGIEF